MGLFGFLKKPKQTLDRDMNPLDANSVIEWYKEKNPNASKREIQEFISKMAKPSDDLGHLSTEGNLPWGWYTENKEFTAQYEAKYTHFLNRWLESRDKSPREQMNALASFVRYMNDTKRICASKGECFDYWRQGLFSEDYLAKRTAELKNLRENIVTLTEKYEIDQKVQAEIVPHLKKDLRSIIRKNPNILQTDVYKMYAPEVKPYISETLYYMEKSKIITRTKQGRTYTLKLK